MKCLRRFGIICILSMLMILLGGIGAQAAPKLDFSKLPIDFTEIQKPDNIAVQGINNLVERDIENYKNGAQFKIYNMGPKVHWLLWGYLAEESEMHGDKELGEIAIKMTDDAFRNLSEYSGTGPWSGINCLTMLMWCAKSDLISQEQFEEWRELYRPEMEQIVSSGSQAYLDGTSEILVNEALMDAFYTRLAAFVYEDDRYLERSKHLIEICDPHFNEDGSYDYYGHSGISPTYWNFEAAWLSLYYAFSGDEDVLERVCRMHKISPDVNGSGEILPADGLWFKMEFFQGGAITAPMMVGYLSKDPLTYTTGIDRLKAYNHDWITTYYAMYFYDETIPEVEYPIDYCRYSTNIEGSRVRKGFWQFTTKNKARISSIASAAYIPKKTYSAKTESYMEAANILLQPAGAQLVVNQIVTDDVLFKGQTHFAVTYGQEDNYSSIAGEDFVAHAAVYTPSQTQTKLVGFTHYEPLREQWKNTQLWFGDQNGFGGWIEVSAYKKDDSLESVKGFIKTGKEDIEIYDGENKFRQKNIRYSLYGEQVKKIWLEDTVKNTIFVDLKKGGARTYKKGEKFNLGLSGTKLECESDATVELVSSNSVNDKTSDKQGVVAIKVQREDSLDVVLAFNASCDTQSFEYSASGSEYYKSVAKKGEYEKGNWPGKIELAQNELVVIFVKRPPVEDIDKVDEYYNSLSGNGDLRPEITLTATTKEYKAVGNVFDDINNHWAEEDINNMYSVGVLSGVGDRRFAPDGLLTRAEAIEMIFNVAQGDYVDANQFIDVNKNDWYFKAINSAYANRFLPEIFYMTGKIEPEKKITREEFCALIIQAIETSKNVKAKRNTALFGDFETTSPWAEIYIEKAVAAGIINGYEDGTFKPDKTVTRAEAAAMVKKMYELL